MHKLMDIFVDDSQRNKIPLDILNKAFDELSDQEIELYNPETQCCDIKVIKYEKFFPYLISYFLQYMI